MSRAVECRSQPVAGPGKVYVYYINGNTLALQATLVASDGQTGDKFGESATVKDNVILTGAPGASIGAAQFHGKAYAFQYVNGQWQQQAILTSSTNGMVDQFGQSVALAPGFGIVGAPLTDMPAAPDNGMIFFFKR